MKKLTAMFLALMLIAPVCMAEGSAHTHVPAEEWDRDLQQHWHACECGEKLGAEDHVMDDYECTVCGSEIWVYDEEYAEIYNYNDQNEITRNTTYGAEGAVEDDYRYLIEYDAEGNRIREENYWFDWLIETIEYTIGPDGWSQPVIQKYFDPEGGSSVNRYDEYGNIIRSESFDDSAALIFEEDYEYTYDEDGMILSCRQTGRYTEGGSYVYESNEHGDDTLSASYAADGTLDFGRRTEYEYNENGLKVWSKTYDLADDRLVEEIIFGIVSDEYDEWDYEKTVTEYAEDGCSTVTEYDDNYNELSVTEYNEDGEIETVYRYEYEFDEYGNIMWCGRYENGRLYETSQYEFIDTEDYSCYFEMIRTEINEDGSMYIREYDMDGNEVSAGLFDKDGNPVSGSMTAMPQNPAEENDAEKTDAEEAGEENSGEDKEQTGAGVAGGALMGL